MRMVFESAGFAAPEVQPLTPTTESPAVPSDGLSDGAIAGIVIVVLGVVIILVITLIFLVKYL